MNQETLLEKGAAAEEKRASCVSHQQVSNPDGSTTRLHKSKREGTAPPSELTASDKSNIAIKSLRYHSQLNMKSGDKQPFVRNGFSHDGLAKRDSIRQLYLPSNAPYSSRDQ